MAAQKRVSRKEAMTSCGTHLKKGYRFGKGGAAYKVVADKKKPAAKKKPATKRRTATKRK